MRKILFGLLLVGAAAPALAAGGPRHRNDDNDDSNRPARAWHQERNNNDSDARPQVQRPAPQRPDFQRPQFERPAPQQRSDVQRPQFGGNVQRSDNRYLRGDQAQAPNSFGTWRQNQQGQQRWNENREQQSNGYVRNQNNWQQRYTNGYVGRGQVVGGYQRQGTQQQRYGGRGYNDANRWNRDWRNDRRYDWRDYRRRDPSRFHIGVYIDPFGWGYQNFGIGYRLQPNYYEQNYWVDAGMYGLPYPPPGMQWVRYWNDALLIDIYSGQVVDEIQGFFW